MSSVYPQRGTKALIGHLRKGREAKWKLVVAASSRSAQAKSQRTEALIEASAVSKKVQQ